MRRLKLRVFVRVAHLPVLEEEAPLPLFLEEYDSVGVRWRGRAKNIIRWELDWSLEMFSEGMDVAM